MRKSDFACVLIMFRRCSTEVSSLLVYLTFIFSGEVTSKRGPPAAERFFSTEK
jgi:hypothetical protein